MPALRSTLRAHPAAALALTALFIIAATQWVRDAGDRLDEMLHGQQYVIPTFGLDSFTFKVAVLDPAAEAAGLRKGDLVLSVNGRAMQGRADYDGAWRRARVGDRLRLRIRRFTPAGQKEQDLAAPLKHFTYVGIKPASPAFAYLLVLRIVTPFLCMALGFWVAAVRVYDRAAWNLLFIMLSVANLVQDDRTIFGNTDSLQPFLTGFSIGLIHLGPIALAYFGITFPERLALDRDHP